MNVSLERLTRNQHIFREVNERLRDITIPTSGPADYICECSARDCRAIVSLDDEEYRAVRARFDVFIVAPGHERLYFERVVEGNDRFMLVKKSVEADRHDPSSTERSRDDL